jgi:hypothetical protein
MALSALFLAIAVDLKFRYAMPMALVIPAIFSRRENGLDSPHDAPTIKNLTNATHGRTPDSY